MDKPISRFFADLGMPLRNDRWSWGAQQNNVMVLRTWSDQYDLKARRVAVLRVQTLAESVSVGLDERIQHLKAIWRGGIAAYTIIATAEDPMVKRRTIKSYRDDFFPIEAIEVADDGSMFARCGRYISQREFPRHAEIYLTDGGAGAFPLDGTQDTGLSSASLREKLPYIRAWLVDIARSGGKAHYADLREGYGLWYGTQFTALRMLGQECVAAGEPVITALVVDRATGRCSKGLYDVFGIEDDVAERERCYAYWGSRLAEAAPATRVIDLPPNEAETSEEENHDAQDERIARYMSVEVRQQQPAFRKAVFEAYDGRCAISGCDIPEALEAAHLLDRSWREGHNDAADGILLRRDLHTLYDRGLLDIADGVANFSRRVMQHYASLEGVTIAVRREAADCVAALERHAAIKEPD